MLTRIRLRRTSSAITSLSNSSNPNHHLKYGEALYSTADKALVIGTTQTETTAAISSITNRFFSIAPQKGNLVYASASNPSSSSATSYPTFRKLVPNDLPDKIPASKITGLVTYKAGGGIQISNSTISNTGVRSVATGDSNGTIKVNTNGTSTSVAVKGLGSAAYKNVADFQAPLQSLTFNSSGSGAQPGTTYNGNDVKTISYNTLGAAPASHTHLYAGSATSGGDATSAVKLQTGRTLKVNLARTSASSAFDGTANITNIGVSGTLAVSNGGTGKASWTPGNILYASSATTLGDEPASDIINSIDWGNLQGWKDTYIWDTNTLNKFYLGSDVIMDYTYNGNVSYGWGLNICQPIVTDRTILPSQNLGYWDDYTQYLRQLTYTITIYKSCVASYNNGNVTYTLSGGTYKTFTMVDPQHTSLGYNYGYRDCGWYDFASEYQLPSSGTRYIVPGQQNKNNYKITNPTTPAYSDANNPDVYSQNWILVYRADNSSSPAYKKLDCCYYISRNSSNNVVVGCVIGSAYGGGNWKDCFYYKDKNPQGFLSSAGWQTTLAKYNTYTHGKTVSADGNTVNIRLRRGSLEDNICKKLTGYRIGDGNFSFTISFNNDSISRIPRLILYGPRSHFQSSNNHNPTESHRELLLIDTMNLQVTDLKPVWFSSDEIGVESIEWNTSTTCSSLTINITHYQTSSSYNKERYVYELNRQGDQYYYYAIA